MTGPKPFEEVEQEMLATSPRQQRPPTPMAAAALEAMQRPGRDPEILLQTCLLGIVLQGGQTSTYMYQHKCIYRQVCGKLLTQPVRKRRIESRRVD